MFVGLDWAEDHHDVYIEDDRRPPLGGAGCPKASRGWPGSMSGSAAHVDDPAEVVIATETDRGLFVGALVAAGYRVLAVNPMSTSRYRERHSTSGAKSDPGDAKVLADLARTDAHNHRPVAGDSELAEAVKVLARAHQSMIWTRQRQTNQLRSTLREFYPAALDAFDELAGRDAWPCLAIAADTRPLGGSCRGRRSPSALRRAGRQRRIDERAVEIQTALRTEQLTAPVVDRRRHGRHRRRPGRRDRRAADPDRRLETELADRFEQHPDAKIIRSLPGLGMTLGARVLGEFGDDPNRYATAKCRKNYSGMSPITRASGKHHVVLARYARNRRLADACYQWAFATLTASPGARAFYDHRRAAGDTHHRALRALGQPTRRHPPRLPPPPHPLRRTHRLGTPPPTSPLDTNRPWDV